MPLLYFFSSTPRIIELGQPESKPGFGNQFNFGYEVEVELSIQLENGNEVEYE